MASQSSETVELVDDDSKLQDLLRLLQKDENRPIYMDLEGINLGSENGTLSLMTVSLPHEGKVSIVDIHRLGHAAFTTKAGTSDTDTDLHNILESPEVAKVVFDIRQDGKTLFKRFGIRIDGVQDLQVMEKQTRTNRAIPPNQVAGLKDCIIHDSRAPQAVKHEFLIAKKEKHKIRDPSRYDHGFGIFNQRPLRESLQRYCVQDVRFLPDLQQVYIERCDRNPSARQRIETETASRLAKLTHWHP